MTIKPNEMFALVRAQYLFEVLVVPVWHMRRLSHDWAFCHMFCQWRTTIGNVSTVHCQDKSVYNITVSNNSTVLLPKTIRQFTQLLFNKSSILLPKTIRQFAHLLSKTSRQCYCLAQFGSLREGEFPTPRCGISRCFARKMPLMIWWSVSSSVEKWHMATHARTS